MFFHSDTILMLSQHVFDLTPKCYVWRKTANTNFVVFGLTRKGLNPRSTTLWGKHASHYITDVVG